MRFGARTNARSQALQLLFQAEATGRMVVDVLGGEYALSDGPLDDYAEQLAVGADSMIHELDAVLEVNSANWGVSRMPSVDRNLLRLAVYEMLNEDDVDIAVTIDEFVELAKAYGTDESSRFVNGLLGRVATLIEAGEDVVAQAVEACGTDEADGQDEDDVEDDATEALAEEAEEAPAEAPLPVEEQPSDDDVPSWAREE
ncbi:MAG: transcription antitermination factor NusB [Atopobiaceae bacterium]|nr:transcription antitermination factor NusB [Atopobiaceae bacterium]